jgi:hypothetical protein
MMSHGYKLKAQECHQTKKVNKAEELAFLSTNIGYTDSIQINVKSVQHSLALKASLQLKMHNTEH